MSNAYSIPWDKGQPITLRLPRDGYQNNPDVVALLSQPDEFLTGVKVQLEGLHEQLEAAVSPVEWLDYVGWLNGWSDEYWDTLWSAEVKRALITASNAIWSGIGQVQTLTAVLDIHGLEYRLWAATSLQLPFAMPAVFSTPKGVLYLRMPLKYMRNGSMFREAERTRSNFVPCTVMSGTVYEYFYLGYSQLGEPMFTAP